MLSYRRMHLWSKIATVTSWLLSSATKLATQASRKEMKVQVVKKKDIDLLLAEMGKDGWRGDMVVPIEGTDE